jgi:WD40 repeat protein
MLIATSCSTHTIVGESKSIIKINTPICGIPDFIVAGPTTGLFIGVSEYSETAGVWSTPAHAFSAALFMAPFFIGGEQAIWQDLNMAVHGHFGPNLLDKNEGRSIAYSKDGKVFAFGADYISVDIDGAKNRFFAKTALVNDLCFSSDGKLLAWAANSGFAQIVDLTGDYLNPITFFHHEPVYTIRFSKDDTYVLTVTPSNTVQVWRTDGGGKPQIYAGTPRSISHPYASSRYLNLYDGEIGASFSSDDSHILVSQMGGVSIYPIGSEKRSKFLRGKGGGIHGIGYSRDGSYVGMTNYGGKTKIWNVSQKSYCYLPGDNFYREVPPLFSTDNSRVAVQRKDGGLEVWNSNGKGPPILLFGRPLAFSPDGAHLLINIPDEGVWLWNLLSVPRASNVAPYRNSEPIKAVFSPGGEEIAIVFRDGFSAIYPGIPREPSPYNFTLLTDTSVLVGQAETDEGIMEKDRDSLSYLLDSPFEATKYAYIRTSHQKYHRLSFGALDRISGAYNLLLKYARTGSMRFSERPVTKARIKESIEKTLKSASRTQERYGRVLVVLYISAHGWLGQDGRPYLLPADAMGRDPATWIAYEDILSTLDRFINKDGVPSPHRRAIVVFDTCQIQAVKTNRQTFTYPEAPEGVTVIFSTSPGQYAWHWSSLIKISKDIKVMEETRWGIPPPPKADRGKFEEEYSMNMSVVPVASACALYTYYYGYNQGRGVNRSAGIDINMWVSYLKRQADVYLRDIEEYRNHGKSQDIQVFYGNDKNKRMRLFGIVE